jgi:hypothetical protein
MPFGNADVGNTEFAADIGNTEFAAGQGTADMKTQATRAMQTTES